MRMHLARCSALESLDRSCAGVVGTILKSLGIRLEMSTFLDFFASCVLRNRTREIIIVCARDIVDGIAPCCGMRVGVDLRLGIGIGM